jgi:hypothetical protein
MNNPFGIFAVHARGEILSYEEQMSIVEAFHPVLEMAQEGLNEGLNETLHLHETNLLSESV